MTGKLREDRQRKKMRQNKDELFGYYRVVSGKGERKKDNERQGDQ